jgi:hypothetical protein
VPDLSVSGDNFDLVGGDPHDPTTTSETRSANAIAEPTSDGYRPCWRKISLITKINSCAQSKNEQEFEASNLNITRRWSLQYTKAALCGCSIVAKANLRPVHLAYQAPASSTFSQNKPATSNQPAVFCSHNKSASTTSTSQTNRVL